MRASAIPLGAMSLSFMACSSREVGSWEAVAVFEDGVDISDDYLYTTSTGTCTYGYSRGLTIFRWNTAFFWYGYSADCEDESYDKKDYGYAQ